MKISGVISVILSMIVIHSTTVCAEPISERTNFNYNATEINKSEQRKFIASACDAVCPNAPYLCKVAFCSVILNRIKSGAFPNTAAEVVMADPIFSQARARDYSLSPSASSLMAYDDAISGFSPHPDLLYSYTTDCADFTLKRRQTLFQVGRYVFS